MGALDAFAIMAHNTVFHFKIVNAFTPGLFNTALVLTTGWRGLRDAGGHHRSGGSLGWGLMGHCRGDSSCSGPGRGTARKKRNEMIIIAPLYLKHCIHTLYIGKKFVKPKDLLNHSVEKYTKTLSLQKNSVKSHNKNLWNSDFTNGWFSTFRSHFWVFYTKWLKNRIYASFYSKEHFFGLMNIIGDIPYRKLANFEGKLL